MFGGRRRCLHIHLSLAHTSHLKIHIESISELHSILTILTADRSIYPFVQNASLHSLRKTGHNFTLQHALVGMEMERGYAIVCMLKQCMVWIYGILEACNNILGSGQFPA